MQAIYVAGNIITLVSMNWRRHILFWLVYCSYFYIQSITPRSAGEFTDTSTYHNAFVSLYCFVPFCIIAVYCSIGYILPAYIEQKKYLHAILSFVILFSAGTFINYFAAILYYKNSNFITLYSKGALTLGYINTIWAMIVSGFAIALQVTAKWYEQQKEIEEITRIKSRNELSLQKNKMHPGFLYSSLDSIHHCLKNNETYSSSMILVLSNLLSYLLYESKTERIGLATELSAVKDFIFLEEMKRSNTILLHVDENIQSENILIPPMIILSILQEAVNNPDKGTINDFRVNIDLSQTDDELLIHADFCTHHSYINVRVPKIYSEVYETE